MVVHISGKTTIIVDMIKRKSIGIIIVPKNTCLSSLFQLTKLLEGIVNMNANRRALNKITPTYRTILAAGRCMFLNNNPKETIARTILDENPKYLRNETCLYLFRKTMVNPREKKPRLPNPK
jgi:hypothetical protein